MCGLPDNQLRDVGNLKELLKLNTLVLSRNQIEDLGQCGQHYSDDFFCLSRKSLRHLLELSKLSCTNNKLVSLGRSLKRNTMLSQLRLSHNRLQAMPPELSNNGQLKLLDIGYNQIKDIAALKVLQELPQLQTLTVAGNPLCRAEDYWERVIAFLPQIEKLDDRLVSGPAAASDCDRVQIPGRGKIKRTAKIHLEGEYGSKVSEKIKRKAASLRREKKLEKAKPKVHTSARQDDNNGSISDPLKDKPKKEKGNKRRKLDGRHVVVDNNGDEKETSAQEVAAGEGEEKMSKGGTGVLKIWTKGGGLETTSAKNQEILAKQLTGSTIGLGGSNAWDDEEDAGPPTNPGLVDVDTNGGTTRSVRAIVTDHRALPVTTYSRWALKKNK
eukprot:scaffold2083_cov419-Prasinococcus_capsulatus_cf.AAC.9